MKTCTKCNVSKPEAEFYSKKAGRKGRRAYCKKCTSEASRSYNIKHNKQMRERSKLYRATNKDKISAYYSTNKDKHNNARNVKRQTSDGKKRRQAEQRRYRLKTYGLTISAFDKLFKGQNGKCAICGLELVDENDKGRKVSNAYPRIDHCHETGKIRGLLCNRCNIAMGTFEDDIELLGNAVAYLSRARL